MALGQFNPWLQLGLQTWFNPSMSLSQNTTQTPRINTTQKRSSTYNSRYPWFDEENYKKLERMVDERWVTWDEKYQVMDQLYEIYYPQVLNKQKLGERQKVINQWVYDNWEALLSWDTWVNMATKLTQLSQMAKQKFWIAYNTPDEQVINAMINGVPNWANLLSEYINSWNPELLYQAWLSDEKQWADYEYWKAKINNLLEKDWKKLSLNWLNYVQNRKLLYDVVDLAKEQWIIKAANDKEALKLLVKYNPELQEVVQELNKIELSDEDKKLLWMKEETTWDKAKDVIGLGNPITQWAKLFEYWQELLWNTKLGNWLGIWNNEPATYEEVSAFTRWKEKLKDDFWRQLANKMWTESSAPLDSMEKFFYRTYRDTENLWSKFVDWANKNLPTKWIYEAQLGRKLTDEEYNQIIEQERLANEEKRKLNQDEVMYQTDLVNDAYQKRIEKYLDPDVEYYANSLWMTEALNNWLTAPFLYKAWWDMAQNRDMPLIIGASIVQPEVWWVLMGMDSFARENQEAFEELSKINWVSYDTARNWANIVWLLSAAVELWLENALWWVETTTAKNIRNQFMNEYTKWVTDMVSKKWFLDMLEKWATTQFRASLEEWLEEILQQTIHNIGTTILDSDAEAKDLIKWLRESFEWGFYNPLNILAWWSDMWKYYKNNKWAMIQSANESAYNLWGNISEWAYNLWTDIWSIVNTVKWIKTPNMQSDLLTRTIPEKVVEWWMKLTPTERARVEQTWITPANFILSEWLAWLDNQDKIIQLANIWAEWYNNVTNTFKEVIPDTEKIESKEAQKMLNIMAKVIENSDILSEEYADYLETIKNLAQQTEFDPYTALAIKRDFDALAWHDLYNSKWQVMKNIEKETIAWWRADLNEKLNELWDKYGVDVRKENQRVMNSITIRDGLLRAMSQNKKNNFLWLWDLWFGALLSSGNPVQAAAMIWLKKFAQNNIWNMAQKLYNLNNTPLTPLEKKGASFIKKWNNNAGNLSLGSIVNNPSSVDNTQQGVDAWDLWALPLDAIKSKEVWNNPTDVENWWRILNNEINENWVVKEMTADEEYQQMVNRIMTPKEVEKIVEMAWNANNLRDFYDGEYNTSLEWLKWEWSDQVEMYAENTFATQRMIEAHPELLDWGTTFSEVLDAYLDWTLIWQSDASIERMDLSQAEAYTPTKFYEPQELKNAEEVWEEANKKVTKANKNEVYQARWDFVIDAHNPWFVQELWLTDAEVNKKLRDWAAYPAKAKNLSNRINDWVAAPYRWAWLENSSIVKSMTVSDADLEKMVKKVEWNSQEYERKYISNAMLALNTHIDWSPLTFEFVRWNELDRVDQQWRTHNVAGNYNEQTNTIRISRAWQNTVAHEMGHYLDYLRGRQLFGVNVTLSEWGGRNLESLTEDQKKFVKHFDSFMTDLKLSWDSYSEYTMTPTEIFARFVGRFTEWTRNTATNDRFGYESKWYNDKFIEKDYIEFTKILQEKSKLDLANEYTKYEEYLEKNEQWKGEPKISEQTMSEDELRKREKRGLKEDTDTQWDKKDIPPMETKYHPDGYLSIKLYWELSEDELIDLQGYEYEPIKRVNIDIYDPDTWKNINSNELKTIQEAISFIEKNFAGKEGL